MKAKTIHFLLPAGLALVLASALWAQPSPPKPETPQRWQHLALEHEGKQVTGDRELARKINQIGREGWELVDVETIMEGGTTTSSTFFFKKPLE